MKNLLNVKMTAPWDDNYSDDEQAHQVENIVKKLNQINIIQAYHLFYWVVLRNSESKEFLFEIFHKNYLVITLNDEIYSAFFDSCYRHWKYTKRSKASAWGTVALLGI